MTCSQKPLQQLQRKTLRLLRRRKTDALVPVVEDGVVGPKEDVAQDPEWPCWHVKAQEATDALLLATGAHLQGKQKNYTALVLRAV